MGRGAWQATVHGVTNHWTQQLNNNYTYMAKANVLRIDLIIFDILIFQQNLSTAF